MPFDNLFCMSQPHQDDDTCRTMQRKINGMLGRIPARFSSSCLYCYSGNVPSQIKKGSLSLFKLFRMISLNIFRATAAKQVLLRLRMFANAEK